MSHIGTPWLPDKGEKVVLDSEESLVPICPKRRTTEELLNNGIINLNKPSGPTSHQVVSWIKDILSIKKAGHSGTLDPKVSGVLPVALGRATKLLKVLLIGGKEYLGILELKRKVKEQALREVFEEFTGDIYQIPPLQAAVKRQLRVRRIYTLKLLEFDGTNALFRTNTESGTYIRTLCHDIGLRLNTEGKMADLRRTRSGQFYEKDSYTLQELKDAFVFYNEEGNERPLRKIIMPVEGMVDHLPEIVIRMGAVDAICHGAPLARPGVLEIDDGIKRGDLVVLKTSRHELVAVAKASLNGKEVEEAEKGIVANPVRVVMETDSYPRMWKQRL
ncbi:MAG: RNA-guided pseudouridylation complex pseudouridine synthase subunit Cbf5 [Thermoplasmata archaeon]|nr:RNA-guided pseudouridylation complex pseudouridine synthase subunit Cbf5 [Thermoplasmata archaeon]